MAFCRENIQHAQELQKWYHDKHAKPRSYTPVDKVWLNSKYIKTKRNRKLEAKFFGPFRVLHPIGKQVYKLELPKKWKIYDVFHLSLLEQDTTRKEWVNEMTFKLEFESDGDGEEYEIKAICDNAVYAKESEGHLPGLYYLILWKGYPKEENTWKPASAVIHHRRLINNFYRDYLEKPTATSVPIDSAPSIARLTVYPRAETTSKQKRSKLAKDSSASKRAKNTWTSSYLSRFWSFLDSR